VIIISDLQLSEHPETIEPEMLKANVPIDRGQVGHGMGRRKGRLQALCLNEIGRLPRTLPGTANTLYVAPSDEHDEEGVLISDVFCNQSLRRKMAEKRMKKLELALRELPAPKFEGSGRR